MKDAEKLSLVDRIQVAEDIIENIKNDMRLKADKADETKIRQQYLLVALRANQTLQAYNRLAREILTIEDSLEKFLKEEQGGK